MFNTNDKPLHCMFYIYTCNVTYVTGNMQLISFQLLLYGLQVVSLTKQSTVSELSIKCNVYNNDAYAII
jgi:hypothetical protein